MNIEGICTHRFDGVRQAFIQNFEDRVDLGAACAVTLDGELLVDLRGGYLDRKKETPWTEDTIVCVYSSGKAVVSLLVAYYVGLGKLDYATPVAMWWPEFAQNGKADITLAQVMSHQAGLCAFVDEIDPREWLDWDTTCTRLAAMAPLWSPGSRSGYHPQTFGYLAGEILRRVSGKSVGELIRMHLERPFGLRIFCGLDATEMAQMSPMTKPTRAPDLGELNEFKQAAFMTKWSSANNLSREEWAGAEIPAANIHADAVSLARFMAVLAGGGAVSGVRTIPAKAVEEMTRPQCVGEDLVLPLDLTWACGMMVNTNGFYGPEATTLGHSGFGGSCVFADPVNRLSFAYTPNKMSHHLVADPRTLRLIDAVYAAL